jgi:hypothetical protein
MGQSGYNTCHAPSPLSSPSSRMQGATSA